MTLYTYGYEKQTLEDLISTAEQLNAKVVDVRYRPTSKNEQWTGSWLKAVLGKRYLHCDLLGNRNYKSNTISLVNEHGGLAFLKQGLDKGKTIILLCMENNPKGCHRTYIAKKMMDMVPGLEIEHILPNGKRIHEQRNLL